MSMGIDELMRRADEDWAQIFEVERHAHDLEDRAHDLEGLMHAAEREAHVAEDELRERGRGRGADRMATAAH